MFWFIWFNSTLDCQRLFIPRAEPKQTTHSPAQSFHDSDHRLQPLQIHLVNWLQQCHVAVRHVSERLSHSECPKQPHHLRNCTWSKRINGMLNLYSLATPVLLHKMKAVILQPTHYNPSWKETFSHLCAPIGNLWDTSMAEQLLITSPGKITSVSFLLLLLLGVFFVLCSSLIVFYINALTKNNIWF